jgi:hypothetical protein
MKSILGIVDQGLVSLVGLALTLVAAGSLSVEYFRIFAVVYACHLIFLALMRANFGDVLVVDQDFEPRSVLLAGLAASAISGAAVAGIAWGYSGSTIVFWGGAASGAALWHDVNRYVKVAGGELTRLAIADAVVLLPVASLAAVGYLISPPDYAIYAAWTMGTVAGGVFLAWQHWRSGGSLKRGRAWHRSQWGRIRFFLGEAVASSAGYQLTLLAIAFLVGSELVAGLRGAQIFAGPLGLVFLGVVMVATRDAAARPDRGRGLLRGLTATSLVLFVLALIAGVALRSNVGGLSSAILSAQWPSVAPFVLPAMLYASGSMLNLAPVVLIRASGRYAQGLTARIVNSGLVLLAVPCALLAGVEAAAWLIAVGNLVGVVFWWRGLRISLSSGDRSVSVA